MGRVQEAWCCAKCGAVLDCPSVRDPEVCWWCETEREHRSAWLQAEHPDHTQPVMGKEP